MITPSDKTKLTAIADELTLLNREFETHEAQRLYDSFRRNINAQITAFQMTLAKANRPKLERYEIGIDPIEKPTKITHVSMTPEQHFDNARQDEIIWDGEQAETE